MADLWMDADHHGNGINWTDVGEAALAGAGGGVAGSLVGAKLGQGFGHILGDRRSLPGQYFQHLGAGMAGALGGGAAGGLVGGAITIIAGNAIAAAHGQSVNLFHGLGLDTLMQGVEAGIGGGLLGGASEALRTGREPHNGAQSTPEPSGEPPGSSVVRNGDVHVPDDRTRNGVEPASDSGRPEQSLGKVDDPVPQPPPDTTPRHQAAVPDIRPVRVDEAARTSHTVVGRSAPDAERPPAQVQARVVEPVRSEVPRRPVEQVQRPAKTAEIGSWSPRTAPTPESAAQREGQLPKAAYQKPDQNPVESPGYQVSVDATRDRPAPGVAEHLPLPATKTAPVQVTAEPQPASRHPEQASAVEKPPAEIEKPPAITEEAAPSAGNEWKSVVAPAQLVRHIEHGGEHGRSQDVAQGRRGLRQVSPVGDLRRPGGANRPGEVAPKGREGALFQRGRGEHGPGHAPEMVAPRAPDHHRPVAADASPWTPGQPPAGGRPAGGGGDDFRGGGGGGFDRPSAAGDQGGEVEIRFGNASVRIPRGGEVRLGRADSPLSEHFSSYPTVSRGHATLGVDESGRVWVRDEGSSNGTFINGRRLGHGEESTLHQSDRVRLGSDYETNVEITHPDLPDGPVTSPEAQPVVLRLSGPDGSLPLRLAPGEEIRVGRDDLGGLTSDPGLVQQISRNHATIGMDRQRRIWIRDDASTNGAWVSDRRIEPGEKVFLDNGDRVKFGQGLEAGVRLEPERPTPSDPVAEPDRGGHPAVVGPAVDEIPAPPLHPDVAARAVADFPSVFDQPRTLDNLHENLRPDTSFDNLMAVREHSYRSNGVEPPALSRENLDSFLADIWNRRSDPKLKIYDAYSGTVRGSVPDPTGYIKDLVDMIPERADGYPRGALAQHSSGYILLTPDNYLTIDPDDLKFVRYSREGDSQIDIRYRVYVNAHQMAAPDLMKGIVHQIVQDSDRFPGVSLAKISGPTSMRADGVVIYVSDIESAGRVVDWLKDYQQRNPDSFEWPVPAMTNQAAPGISVGAEPEESMGRVSFGSVRSGIISEQLHSAQSFAEFQDAVLRGFDRNGIDSLRPHRNTERL
ncbi:FHA domain-containing protein [Nocardia sp. NBC_01327]|uniref:FHA domain-containing protein n=1 Tax=Nocardia sp. NBC_01327 TaxID=2903593 RepID=UPI002E147E80|nr:FHA domain-containing protein [Nocardia sp. NBC_01327]